MGLRWRQASQPEGGAIVTNHTPGPWVKGWYRRGKFGTATHDQGFDIYGADNRTVARVPVVGDNRPLQESNAHLIMEAPALLALAKDTRDFLLEQFAHTKDKKIDALLDRIMCAIENAERVTP